MTRPSDSNDWQDLIAGYVLGNLTPEESEALRQQLAQHPELIQEVMAYQESLALLPYQLPPKEPPVELKQKLLNAAIATDPQIATPQSLNSPEAAVPKTSGLHPASPRPLRSRAVKRLRAQRRWAIASSIAAAAIAAVGLGTAVQWRGQALQQAREMAALQAQLETTRTELAQLRQDLGTNREVVTALLESETQVHSLVGAEGDRSVAANLLATPGNPNIVLVADDLPQLPEEQIYRLWAVVDPASAPLYCGQFRHDESGLAQWMTPDTACTETPLQLLITLDAPEDPITSAGPLVMQSEA